MPRRRAGGRLPDKWRANLTADGTTYSQWLAWRRAVAAHLPLPCTVCTDPVQPWQRWHLEHIVPLSKGGARLDPANLGPAHARCNTRKGGSYSLERARIVKASRDW